MDTIKLAQFGYEAYGEHENTFGKWKTFDGREMPKWNELVGIRGEETKARWETATCTIILKYMSGSLPPEAVNMPRDYFAEYISIWGESLGWYVDLQLLKVAIRPHDGEAPLPEEDEVTNLVRDFVSRAASAGYVVTDYKAVEKQLRKPCLCDGALNSCP